MRAGVALACDAGLLKLAANLLDGLAQSVLLGGELGDRAARLLKLGVIAALGRLCLAKLSRKSLNLDSGLGARALALFFADLTALRCCRQSTQPLFLVSNGRARGALRCSSLLAGSIQRKRRSLRLADALLQADVLLAKLTEASERLLQCAGVGQRIGELRQFGC